FLNFKYHVITLHHDVDTVTAYHGASLSKYSFLSPCLQSSGKLKLFLPWSVRFHILSFLLLFVSFLFITITILELGQEI
ncbi:hypothetical protein VIGAN_11145000, partial [Vigna angularis var. angularis]